MWSMTAPEYYSPEVEADYLPLNDTFSSQTAPAVGSFGAALGPLASHSFTAIGEHLLPTD
jgi:hypothetical protein